MFKLVLSACICVFFVAACSKVEEQKTAEWWKDHPEEMEKKLAECKSTGEVSLNCENIKTVKFFSRKPKNTNRDKEY